MGRGEVGLKGDSFFNWKDLRLFMHGVNSQGKCVDKCGK